MLHNSINRTICPLRCAFSLLEITISTLLVSLVLVSSLQMTGTSLLTWLAMDTKVDAQALAHDLMAEILAVSYEDPEAASPDFGIETDETSSPTNRLEFDDTDDYISWEGMPPERRDGTAVAGFTGWERVVSIIKINAYDPSAAIGSGTPDQGVRRVQVTVRDPGGDELFLSAIVSKFGAVEKATGVDTEFITAVTVELSAGTGSATVQGTDLINHANGP